MKGVVVVSLAVATLTVSPAAIAWQHSHGQGAAGAQKTPDDCPMTASRTEQVVGSLQAALESIRVAGLAADEGTRAEALASARDNLERAIDSMKGRQDESRCPMMGSAKEAETIEDSQEKEHKGHHRAKPMCGRRGRS